MRKVIIAGLAVLCMTGCGSFSKEAVVQELPPEQVSVFASSDKQMEKAYQWAKKMALSYTHDDSDPVGYWYEAALPQREAFCMRDVSHQSVGAQILGLAKHNKNMFMRFAENISEEKDWCTYWEINRYNKPASADYSNDKEFWYNLNANFDVMQACLKMYDWTGDEDYLVNPRFTDFYEKSVHEYVQRWDLEPDKIMSRPPYMNQSEDFNPDNNFHTCRGLPSYVENFRGLTVGVDLLATLYAGFNAYAEMAAMARHQDKAAEAAAKAVDYQHILEEKWWNADSAFYQTFWTEDRKFHRGEGVPFVLWFDATKNTERIRASVDDILQREWNVENMSAFPALFYRLGYYDDAYRFLTSLPQMNRSEYPEVSYGIIEGTVCGVMGIKPHVRDNSITTCSRLPEDTQEAEIKNVPVFDGYITVKHEGRCSTEIVNNTTKDLVWKAAFIGEYSLVEVNGKAYPAVLSQDVFGNSISEACIPLPANAKLKVGILPVLN